MTFWGIAEFTFGDTMMNNTMDIETFLIFAYFHYYIINMCHGDILVMSEKCQISYLINDLYRNLRYD